MKKISIFLVMTILVRLNAMTLVELYQNPELEIQSSFFELWESSFGDALDLRFTDDMDLTPEMRKVLILRITDSNNHLFTENTNYLEKKNGILDEINALRQDLSLNEKTIINLKKERSLLLLRKSFSNNPSLTIGLINSNRKEIYDYEKSIIFIELKISALKQDLSSTARYLILNNQQIRRNNMRISFLGGLNHEETPVSTSPILKSVSPEETLPLIDPETLPFYSMAAMEGIELEKCPKHDSILEYTYKKIEDTYRGVKYSYPLYAGWCQISNRAYIYREAEDHSKKVIIEIRNKKMKQIDEMLKKS